MHDYRVIGGPALGGIEFADCRGVTRIGAKAIDGFRRERDQSAASQDGNGFVEL